MNQIFRENITTDCCNFNETLADTKNWLSYITDLISKLTRMKLRKLLNYAIWYGEEEALNFFQRGVVFHTRFSTLRCGFSRALRQGAWNVHTWNVLNFICIIFSGSNKFKYAIIWYDKLKITEFLNFVSTKTCGEVGKRVVEMFESYK